MKRYFWVLFISLFLINGCAIFGPKIKLNENPKLFVYWTAPTMSEEEALRLAKFHIIIADMENMVNNHKSLELLKKTNPKIRLLAYSNPMEFFSPMVTNRPMQKKLYDDVRTTKPEWWLFQPNGSPVIFFRGMKMLNMSINCPVIDGYRWNRFVAKFLIEKVLFDPIWDGYFMDNSGGNISWVARGNIDSNNDGIRDNPADLDLAWSEGIKEFLTMIRNAKGPNFIMIGNKMTLEFLDILDAKMAEEFPNNYLGSKKADGWYKTMENYLASGKYSLVHALQIANGPEHRIFVISSALMGDGYYGYGHNLTLQFPEYRDIGKALGPAQQNPGLWIREFEKATIKVWPEEKRGEIIYKK